MFLNVVTTYANRNDNQIRETRETWQWNKTDVGSGGYTMYGVVVGDGDNDGSIEVYAACGEDPNGYIYQFKWNGVSWVKNNVGFGGSRMRGIAIGDGDNDGNLEIYGTNQDQYVYQFEWSGSSWNKYEVSYIDYYCNYVAVGDGDNDNNNEVYAVDSSLYHLYEFEGSGSSWAKNDLGSGGNGFGLAVGDGDNDGSIEVYVACAGSKGSIKQFSKVGGNWQTTPLDSGGKNIVGVAIGDGDNDGLNEVYGAAGEGGHIFQYKWTGSTWGKTDLGGNNLGTMYGVAIGDGDNDGLNEVYGSHAEGYVYQFKLSGTSWVKSVVGSGFSILLSVAVGDGNNTGKNEVYASCGDNHVYQFEITNTAPIVTNSEILPTVPKTTDNLTVNFTYSDPEDNPESGSEIRWYKNGELQPEFNDTKTIPLNATIKNEIWNFSIIPKDGLYFGIINESTSVIINNTPPQIINVTNDSPKPGNSNFKLEVNASDPDVLDGTDTLEYRWDWENDGTWDTLFNTSNITNHIYLKGIYSVKVEVIDGNNSVFGITEIDATNNAPVVSNLFILPSNPTAINNLIINYTYEDADYDIESGTIYKWFKDEGDGVIDSGIGTKTVSYLNLEKGDKWKCEVTPCDSFDFGIAVNSSSIIIGNTAPNITLISPSDNEIIGTTYSTLTWNGSDLDNDTIYYDVYLDSDKDLVALHDNSVLRSSKQIGEMYYISNLDNGVTYYWAVIVDDKDINGINSSEIWSFTVNTSKQPTPVSLMITSITEDSITLSWTKNEDLDFLKYEIHKSLTSGFTLDNSTLVIDLFSQSTTIFNVTELLPFTKYYFKVRIVNKDELSTDSNEVSATTLKPGEKPSLPPPPVHLLYPLNNSEINTTNPTFSWYIQDSSSNNLVYNFYLSIWENPMTSDPIQLTETQYTPENPLIDGMIYYWTVIPINGSIVSTCKDGIWSFTVDLNATPTKINYGVKIEVMIGDEKITIKQCENTSKDVRTTNLGDVTDIFTLSLNAGKVSDYVSLRDNAPITLVPNNSSIVDLIILIPENAPTGIFNISITAVSFLGGPSVNDTVNIQLTIESKVIEPVQPPSKDNETKEGIKLDTIILVGIIVLIIILFLIAIAVIIKRKKRERVLEIEKPGIEEVEAEVELKPEDLDKEKELGAVADKLKIKRRPRRPIEILKAEEKPLSIEELPTKPMLGPSKEEEFDTLITPLLKSPKEEEFEEE